MMDDVAKWALFTLFTLTVPGNPAGLRSLSQDKQAASRDAKQDKPRFCSNSSVRVRFKGEVLKGQNYSKKVHQGLEFSLNSSEQGWIISVHSSANPTKNYAVVATPPYRGMNPMDIEGWHFRNADNTGPNAGEVNAPQELREFGFVLSEAGFEIGAKALETVLWRYSHTDKEVQEASKVLDETLARAARGKLRIVGMKLGNLEKGKQAWFEWMKFQADLCIPRGEERP